MAAWLSVEALVSEALGRAAGHVAPAPTDKGFQERRLEDALVESLGELVPDAEIVARRGVPALAPKHWNPLPGAFDVVVSTDELRLLFELKVDDIGDSVWDIEKLACVPEDLGYTCVAAVAARHREWERDRVRSGIYTPIEGEVIDRSWSTRFLIEAYESEWQRALTYNPRPLRLPSTISMAPIGVWELPAFADYQLRAVRVSSLDDCYRVELVDGWPAPPGRHEIADSDLRAEDIPASDAPMEELLFFAGTTNGYDRCGSPERLQSLAADVQTQWLTTGELPESLRQLRSCLFALQRADHFGFTPDEKFLRALVRRIGEAVSG
jgi:hypothetical protein